MKKFIPFILFIFTACNTLPELYKGVEDIETNNALDISLSKDTLDTGKNIFIIAIIDSEKEK